MWILTMHIDKIISNHASNSFHLDDYDGFKKNETTESYYLRTSLKLQVVVKIGAEAHAPWEKSCIMYYTSPN